MPRVLISGYYGFDNLGDDTVLFGILTSLRKQNPALEFAVLSNQPERTSQIFGIPAFDRWNGWTIFSQLIRSDLLIVGGGTLLQDITSPRSIPYYLGIVGLAKLLRKPVVFFAQGFGPVHLPLSKKMISAIVNRVDLITVRDDKSKEDFLAYGVTKPSIQVTADPALSIHPEDFPREHGANILREMGALPTQNPNCLLIGVAIRDWHTDHPYQLVLAEALDRLVAEGHSVVFVPMQYPRDILASEKVASHMNKPYKILSSQFSFRDMFSIISNLDLVIGMRLHSLILAAVFKIPFVSLSYDPKIERFVQRMGLSPAMSVDSLDADLLFQEVLTSTENLDELKERMGLVIKELQDEAEKSAIWASEYLHS